MTRAARRLHQQRRPAGRGPVQGAKGARGRDGRGGTQQRERSHARGGGAAGGGRRREGARDQTAVATAAAACAPTNGRREGGRGRGRRRRWRAGVGGAAAAGANCREQIHVDLCQSVKPTINWAVLDDLHFRRNVDCSAELGGRPHLDRVLLLHLRRVDERCAHTVHTPCPPAVARGAAPPDCRFPAPPTPAAAPPV